MGHKTGNRISFNLKPLKIIKYGLPCLILGFLGNFLWYKIEFSRQEDYLAKLFPQSLNAMNRNGQGVMLFAYGSDENVERYLSQAIEAGEGLRKLNPTVKLAIVTNDGVEVPDMFDHVIRPKMFGRDRQWVTRIIYMARSPFNVTLVVDTQVTFCSGEILSLLADNVMKDFDFSVNTERYNSIFPHNCAMVFKSNERTMEMFREWFKEQFCYSRNGGGDDQGPLLNVLIKMKNQLSIGIMTDNYATAFVSKDKAHFWPRSTHMIFEGKAHLIHSRPAGCDASCICSFLNQDSDKKRVILQESPDHQIRIITDEDVAKSIENLALFNWSFDPSGLIIDFKEYFSSLPYPISSYSQSINEANFIKWSRSQFNRKRRRRCTLNFGYE